MRVTTDTNGSATATSGHFPFGENWYETGGTNKLKFTSYERDAESGNDYAMFRSHISRLGRFSSPDRLAGSISDPQSLNRYAYVRNNPVNLIDPLGLCLITAVSHRFLIGNDPGSAPEINLYCGDLSGGGGDILALLGDERGEQGEGGGGSQRPEAKEAEKILEKKECIEFLLDVALKAATIAMGGSLSNDSAQLIRDSITAANLSSTIQNAKYVEKPNETPKAGKYVTTAKADFDTQTVTLYGPYFKTEFMVTQSQTLIHESLHLLWNFSDPQLGRAATGKRFEDTDAGRASASHAFSQKLAEKCR